MAHLQLLKKERKGRGREVQKAGRGVEEGGRGRNFALFLGSGQSRPSVGHRVIMETNFDLMLVVTERSGRLEGGWEKWSK